MGGTTQGRGAAERHDRPAVDVALDGSSSMALQGNGCGRPRLQTAAAAAAMEPRAEREQVDYVRLVSAVFRGS